MTLRGWLNTLDNLTPRCQRCNRKIRNGVKCRTCGVRLCSESCFEKHFKLVHAPQLKKQQADAALAELKKQGQQIERDLDTAVAELKRLNQLKKQQADVAAAKKEKLNQLKEQKADAATAKKDKLEKLRREIQKATALHEERLNSWRQAGSPDVQQGDLDRAKEEASRRRALLREANMGRHIISVKIGYLKAAHFIRRTSGQLGMEWFAAPMIGGVVAFAFAILFGLLFTKSLGLTLALGGIGFLGGFLAFLCLLFLPDDDAVRRGIAALSQQESDQLEPLDAVRLAYEKAQNEYDHLARLHQLRTDCESASLETQRLQAEYQVTCTSCPPAALPEVVSVELAQVTRPDAPFTFEDAGGGGGMSAPSSSAAAPSRGRSRGRPFFTCSSCIGLTVLLSCAGLCGTGMIGMYFGLQGAAEAKKALVQADQDWDAGKKADAVSVYKSKYALTDDKAKLVKRIADYEAGAGNAPEARKWVEKGLDDQLNLVYDTPAQAIYTQVKKERDDKAAQEKAEAAQREHDAQVKAEADAANRVLAARDLLVRQQKDAALAKLAAVAKQYPGTRAAKEAQEWLDEMDRQQRSRLADAARCLEVADSKPYLAGLVQIPATVIDKGVLRNVPYKSYRAGDYEVNVYGDPDQPAGVEIGVYRNLVKSQAAKVNCTDFIASVLADPQDKALLGALKMTKDTVMRDGLTVEVTPETADDSYGGWWVSAYRVSSLDQARASDAELNQIAVQRKEVQTNPANAGEWTAPDLQFARPAPATVQSQPSSDRVYVRGYTRKDGTYVHSYTRRHSR